MIENLSRIAEGIRQYENPTWQDVGRAFYGEEYKWDHNGGDFDFGIYVKSTKPDIISLVERPGVLKHYEFGDEFHSGFYSPRISYKYPYIHLINHMPFLSEVVLKEFFPEEPDQFAVLDKINDGKVPNFPYNFYLELEAISKEPKDVYLDALDGIVSLLQGLEQRGLPYWFHRQIQGFPKGLKFL